MNKSLGGFHRAGHTPTLIAAFLYFDVSFMIWVLLGPLGPFIGEELRLTATQKGFLIATPLLGGSLFRPFLGVLADRIGGRRTGLLGLGLTLVPLLAGWRFAGRLDQLLLVGLLLGVAGASFAVALPLAGGWYPPEYQGLAMGIAGAGNSGTLLATLFAPRLAQAFGWRSVFGVAMLPVCVAAVVFALLARDSPRRRAALEWRDYAAAFREADTGWFCLLYSLTFGGFVGLASFLTVFFHEQYHVSKIQAGDFTSMAVLAGSFLRPVGGLLSDRMGGYRLLLVLLTGAGLGLAGIGFLPSAGAALLLAIAITGMLGMGNGAVFQLVPQRFPKQVGLLTGLVGAAGGLGGFLLPSVLGAVKDRTGQYGWGFLLGAAAVLAGAAVLLRLGSRWQGTWPPVAVKRAGIFCYRSLKLKQPAPETSNAAT